MRTFAQLIAELERQLKCPGRWKELTGNVFGSPEGAEWLAMLYAIAHPCDQTLYDDPRFDGRVHAWCELSADFWRNSSSTNNYPATMPEPQPETPNA